VARAIGGLALLDFPVLAERIDKGQEPPAFITNWSMA